jgi:8-oxo-dGTP pyrophosphatase MutT (NUDIX family)
MHRNDLLTQIEQYRKSNFIIPEEQLELGNFISFIKNNERCFERSNCGHVTSGVWIVNAQRTHALLTHHKKFNMWVQLGGHNDGDPDCKATALKEAEEESGITGFTFLHNGIFDIDIHQIPGPCTYHYDIRYLLQAPKDAQFIVSEESHDLAWIPFNKISEYTLHSSVLRMNEKYKKLFS